MRPTRTNDRDVRDPRRLLGNFLLLGAALVAGWLVLQAFRHGPVPGCGDGDCTAVLSSKWARAFGVPVGAFGAAIYLMLSILGWKPIPPHQRLARIAAGVLMILVVAAALWFVALQAVVIRSFCPWCTGTHLTATAGVILLAWAGQREAARQSARVRATADSGRVWRIAGALAALMFAAFVVAQFLAPEPPRMVTASMSRPVAIVTNQPPPRTPPPPGPRELSLHDGRFTLAVGDLPITGSPRAEHVIVAIADFTCRYCRRAEVLLEEVFESFGSNRLAVLQLPHQRGGSSVEVQKLMLAAWKADPAAWAAVARDLYHERIPAEPAPVRTALEARLGPGRLDASLSEHLNWVTNLLATTRAIFDANREKAKSGSVPQFVLGSEIIVGVPENAGEFFALLEKHVGLARDSYPEIAWSVGATNLGRVFAGTPQVVSFTFTNTGKVPLHLAQPRLPTGGRALRIPTEPFAPGQTGLAQVSIQVPVREGPFTLPITFLSNARQNETPVALSGESWKPVKLEPAIVDFGRLEASASATQMLVRIHLDDPVRLGTPTLSNPKFTATLADTGAGGDYHLIVATRENLLPGLHQANIYLPVLPPVPTGWPGTLAVGARALVERAVTVVPAQIGVSRQALPTNATFRVSVRCTDNSPGFAVTEATLEGVISPAVPQIVRGSAPNESRVEFMLSAGWQYPETENGPRLLISTTHGKYPTIEVPLVPTGSAVSRVAPK